MIQSSSWPRSPGPIWASEMRSLAPRILAYETAFGTTAAPISAADPARKVLRSVFASALLIVCLPCAAYDGDYRYAWCQVVSTGINKIWLGFFARRRGTVGVRCARLIT